MDEKILNCLLPKQIWHSVGNFIFFSLLLVFHIGYLGVNVLLQGLASQLCHCLSMAIDGWWWSTFLQFSISIIIYGICILILYGIFLLAPKWHFLTSMWILKYHKSLFYIGMTCLMILYLYVAYLNYQSYHFDCLERYTQELQQLKLLGKQHFKACFTDE